MVSLLKLVGVSLLAKTNSSQQNSYENKKEVIAFDENDEHITCLNPKLETSLSLKSSQKSISIFENFWKKGVKFWESDYDRAYSLFNDPDFILKVESKEENFLGMIASQKNQIYKIAKHPVHCKLPPTKYPNIKECEKFYRVLENNLDLIDTVLADDQLISINLFRHDFNLYLKSLVKKNPEIKARIYQILDQALQLKNENDTKIITKAAKINDDFICYILKKTDNDKLSILFQDVPDFWRLVFYNQKIVNEIINLDGIFSKKIDYLIGHNQIPDKQLIYILKYTIRNYNNINSLGLNILNKLLFFLPNLLNQSSKEWNKDIIKAIVLGDNQLLKIDFMKEKYLNQPFSLKLFIKERLFNEELLLPLSDGRNFLTRSVVYDQNIVEYLVGNEELLILKDSFGDSILSLAIKFEDREIIRSIVQHSSNHFIENQLYKINANDYGEDSIQNIINFIHTLEKTAPTIKIHWGYLSLACPTFLLVIISLYQFNKYYSRPS